MARLAETAALVASLVLEDKFSKTADKFDQRVGSLSRGMGQLDRGVGQLASGIGRLATIGAGAFVGAIGASVKVAADFEAQLNTINTIAQATPAALGDIGVGIRALARDTGTSLDDLTKAYYDLLSAGIGVADAQKILEQANLLSVGTLGTTAQAVDVLTTALNAFRLDGSDAARVSEELAVAVERGKVTLDQIAPSYANVAQTASVAGLETREIAAAFAALTSQGVAAEEVTTQMNRAILSLIAPTTKLADLQEDLGVNFAEIAREDGLVVALEELRKAGDAAGIPLLDLLGRAEAFKFLLATTGPNLQSYNEDLEAVTNSAGTLADQVGARRQGLAFQFQVLKANIRDAGITIGSALLPTLTPVVQELTDLLGDPSTQQRITSFAEGVADAIRDLVDSAKSGNFQPFIDGLTLLGDIAGKAYEIFRKLPPEIQTLLVTGAALNRLSGGQLLGGASNIAGGLLRIIFERERERGSSPVNPLYVSQVGLGGGTVGGGAPVGGAPVGGAGGGLGGVAAGFVGTAGVLATTTGGVLALGDITNGTEEGVEKGFTALSGGFTSLIARAIEGAIGTPLDDIFGEGKKTTDSITKMTSEGRGNRDVALRASEQRRSEAARALQAMNYTAQQQVSANMKLGGILAKPQAFTVNNSTTVNIDGRKVAGVVTKSQFFSGTVPK